MSRRTDDAEIGKSLLWVAEALEMQQRHLQALSARLDMHGPGNVAFPIYEIDRLVRGIDNGALRDYDLPGDWGEDGV